MGDRITGAVRPAVRDILPWATGLWRRLHQCPESCYEERETSAIAREALAGCGLGVLGPFAKTGLAAVWDSGRPGPLVAFRADMDGLPIEEPAGEPGRSHNPGFMHACGHDFNLAVVLSLAKLLTSGGLKPLRGRVMFICQPAEERGAGAAAMLADGLWARAGRPDFIFAGHADPGQRPGRLTITPGPVMAGVLDLFVTVTGRGGHAATPWSALNPLPAIAALATALCGYRPPEGALLTVTVAHCGTRNNVIAPSGTLEATMRYYSEGAKGAIESFVAASCREAGAAHGAGVEWDWRDGYPPAINDAALAARLQAVAEAMLGPGAAGPEKPSYGGEDFAFFLREVPGVFLHFGTGPSGPLHSPGFKINDAALPIGLEFWARVAETMLGNEPKER